ncbi:MAG TPA: transketolase [bacterium]|nr:transketolase [bacterium]HPQ65194.1 transketolase [bacterium]
MTVSIRELEDKALHIRNLVLDMCSRGGTGHVTSSFSCTEILVTLFYGGLVRFDPNDPHWAGRDRFILSKGQASVILYPILADLGFIPKDYLDSFIQADGKFGVHLQHDIPGAEITAGSLGDGFGIAAGMALAAKHDRRRNLVFTLLGDGENYEGSIWETAMFAAHNRLNNLIAIIDRNYICATDFTEDMVALEPLDEKWRAFGWTVKRVDGHSFRELLEALDGVRSRRTSKPLMIVADTVKGKGVSFISDDPMWHSCAPKPEEAEIARRELNQERGQ